MANVIAMPQGPMDFSSLYARPQPGMPLPMTFNGSAPQNVPQAPVDQNFMVPNPEQGPQPTQTPPQLQHITDVIGQYIQSKQDQQNSGGLTEAILAQRFQPNLADASRSVFQSNQAGQYYSPEQAAATRMQSELAPYTTAMDLQGKQLGLQKAQIENQYAPEMEQAKIQALRAQSGFMGQNGGVPQGQSQVSGDQYLQTLPPQIATQVKALAEGRMQFPAGFALKSPYWQQMISAVSQYDPSFDAVNYASRAKTRASFTSGADANNVTALNTAMAHLGTLSDNYNKLGNTDYPWLNQAVNYAGNKLGNRTIQTNTGNVSADAEAVSHELAKVFRSTGMSEGEIDAWKQKITTDAGPAQSQAVINSALDLIDGRLSALGEKYSQGMGAAKQGIELLSPDAQKAYQKLRGGAPQQPAAAPAPGGISDGATATNPQTGEKIIFKNGQWGPLQ